MIEEVDDDGALPATLIEHMTERPNAASFLLVVKAAAEYMVFYDKDRLVKLYDYVQSVRRGHAMVPDSKIYSLAECACAMLDSFFETMGPYERMGKLVWEFRKDTVWQFVLRALYNSGKEGLDKNGINKAVKARMPGVVLDMAYLSNILIIFQIREVVELCVDFSKEDDLFRLSELGCELFLELRLDRRPCDSCGHVP